MGRPEKGPPHSYPQLWVLRFFLIFKNAQSNSVSKLVVARNVSPHGRIKRASGFLRNVKFDDERHKVFPFCVSFDGSEFNPINTSSVSEPDTWSTDAKLKLKVGVVSATVKQHTEGRLQDSQSMLDRCVAQAPWMCIQFHWRHGCPAFVLACLAIKRMVFRKSLAAGRSRTQTTDHKCRGLKCSHRERRIEIVGHHMTCVTLVVTTWSCMLLQSSELNDKCRPRGASGALHQRAGNVRRCHGVPW